MTGQTGHRCFRSMTSTITSWSISPGGRTVHPGREAGLQQRRICTNLSANGPGGNLWRTVHRDGYASDRWKTAEVISNIGSTAGMLYLRDYVTYQDNTTEEIETAVYPYPVFSDASPVVIQRGSGLFAMKSEDERKNEAAASFSENGSQRMNIIWTLQPLPATCRLQKMLFPHSSLTWELLKMRNSDAL